MVLANTGAYFAVAVRAQSVARTYYYYIFYGINVWKMYKCVAGTRSQIGSNYTVTTNINDVIKLEVDGTILTPYHNGIPQTSQTDSTISDGAAAIFFYLASNQVGDNWEGGNVGIISLSINVHG